MRVKFINCWNDYSAKWWSFNLVRFGYSGDGIYLIVFNLGIKIIF